MSDPKYNKYKGTVRFDDDNIVDIDLQPDTENITVLLNGEEVTGGSGLPDVTSEDNGDVLTVVSGEWTNAAPASQLPAVSGSDNGNVLTVVEGSWSKAAPAGQLPAVSSADNGNVLTVVEGSWAKAAPAGGGMFIVTVTEGYDSYTADKTFSQIAAAFAAGQVLFAMISGDYSLYPLSYFTPGDEQNQGVASFTLMSINNMGCFSDTFSIVDDDSISLTSFQYPSAT